MNPRLPKALARTAGALLGLGLALVFLLAERPAAKSAPFPAIVRASMAPTGELQVTPPSPRPVLVADSLLPGSRPASGTFRVRNQTGVALGIALKTVADSTALNGLVRLRLSADGKPLADTTLQGMESRKVRLKLASGAQSKLRLQAWIPSDVLTGYEGRRVDVSLVPTVRNRGGPG